MDFRVFTERRVDGKVDTSHLEADTERKLPVWRASAAVLVRMLLSEATQEGEDLLARWVAFARDQSAVHVLGCVRSAGGSAGASARESGAVCLLS